MASHLKSVHFQEICTGELVSLEKQVFSVWCAWWWRLSTHALLVLGSGGMLLHPRKRGLLGGPKSDRNATRSGRQVSSLYPSRSNWMPLTLSCGTYSSPPQYLLIPIPNRVHSLGPAALLASYVPCQTLDLFPLRQMHNSDQAEVGVVYHTCLPTQRRGWKGKCS